jgi:hypothetical protein
MASQYGTYALRAGLARLYTDMRMHTPTRPGTHMHARANMHTHKYVILIAFHDNNCSVNAPECYGICALSVLFVSRPICHLLHSVNHIETVLVIIYTIW